MALYLFPFALFAALAVFHHIKLLRLDRALSAAGFLGIGLFAGLRFETGQDWPAYETFFENLDLSDSLFELYFSTESARPTFEIGFYALNYVVKYLGGTYSAVLLLSSLFCAFAVYRLTSSVRLNRFYILTIYVSYSFMILHFAQARQAIAIGFFVLGCDYYLRHIEKMPALLIAMAGPLFQFTSLMYIVLLPAVFWWPRTNRLMWTVVLWLVAVPMLIALAYFFDFYSILTLLAGSASAEEKIAIYRETQTDQGTGQRLYAIYLFALVCYFYRYSRNVAQEHSFIVSYAIVSLMLTIVFTIIFPGSYVMYSRAYVAASIFQGYAAALIFSSVKPGWLHNTVFIATLLVAGLSYWRLIAFYADEYLPYRTIVSLGFL